MYTILEQENKNLFQKTLDDLKTQIKFVGTFGFGITGLYETVQELLYGKYPTLSEHEIILIFLAALSYFSINVIDDVKKLNKIIKEKGLKEYLNQTIETLKDFENLAIEIGKKAGHTISSLAELVGYIYLLIPILETVQRLVTKEGFDIVTLGIYLKSILTSVGIFYTKNVFDRLIGRLKRNIPKDDKDVIKEHTERKDKLRRVLDKYEKDYKRISPELIIDLAIEDPSSDYEYLDWMVDQVKMGFFLGVDLKYISKLINRFHNHKDILTKGRLLRMLDRFKIAFPASIAYTKGTGVWNNDEILAQILEDPSDINNYPGYGQVEQILQMIDFSAGGSQPDLQVEQIDYLQKKGEQSTRKVVSDILKIIKKPDSNEEFYQLPDYFSGIDGDMYEFGELEFNVYVNVVEYDSLVEPFIVDAEMGGDYDDEIYVTITVGPEFSNKDYEEIQMVLNDYIRHEIEHVIDATEGGDIESPDNLSPYDYYMQPHEVRAQKAGFNRKAKLEKKPVEDIIYDYLEYRQKIDKLSDEQKSNLTKTLSEHKKSKISPDLDEGDTIRVIEVDGEHANMPEVWGIYKVHDVRQDSATQRFYYELSGKTSEIVPDTTFSTTRLTNSKYLYPGDVWIPVGVNKKTLQENKQLNENKQTKSKLINKFIKDFWPKYRSQVYSELYNTYHPSTYTESFVRPSSQFENALETIGEAVHEGKKLGLIDSSVDWSDTIHYDVGEDGIKRYGRGGKAGSDENKRLIDDDGIPTLNDQLEIMDSTNLDWIHGILLFDVLEDIVDEFKSYCGENGIDESGMGKCMDDFPPQFDKTYGVTPDGHGTLKQDYYTLFNFMKELERVGIPVTEYMRSPLFPNIIKLVDDGTTDYDTTGGYSPMRQDSEAMDAEEILMDVPDRISEHEQPGLNPELEVGDKILVVNVDREVENNSIKYHIPPPELKPDLYVSYTVVDKESNGSESKYPFRYTLVPEDKLEDYEKLLDRGYGDYEGYEKLLFPWLYQWIYANTPMANKVDRKTISEHKESKKLNPELMVGDEILVVSTEGIHDFGAPELYKPYVVVGIKYGHLQTIKRNQPYNKPFFQIEPLGMTDEDRTGAMLAGGGRVRPMYIFSPDDGHTGSDQWILRPGFLRGEHLTEHVGESRNMKGFTPKLIGYLKFLFETKEISNDYEFVNESSRLFNITQWEGRTLYLILMYNSNHTGNKEMLEMLYNMPIKDYAIPSVWEYDITYYGDYDQGEEEEECSGQGYGEVSGEDCECQEGVRYVQDEDGDEVEEDCDYPEDDDCQCQEFFRKSYEVYYNNVCTKTILSTTKLENTHKGSDKAYGYEQMYEIDGELNDTNSIVEHEDCELDYEDGNVWEYFNERDDDIIGMDTDKWDVAQIPKLLEKINNKIYGIKPLIDIIEDQYDVMSDKDTKMKDLTSQIFDILDDNFDMFEHPEGEIEYNGKNMGLYSYHNDSFVPFEHIYNPIMQMLEGGIQQEDIEVFVEIITNWVNYVMSEKREYLNEEVNIKSDDSNYSKEDYEKFVDFAHKELNIEKDCPIDVEAEKSTEYTTGNYHIQDRKIKVLDNGRKLADILRTIAHELVHHKQNELGQLVGDIPEIGGTIEDQANAYAGRLVKKYGKQTPSLYLESKIDIISEEKVVGFSDLTNNFVVIAGGPGAGKSFITKNLVNLDNVKEFNVDQVRVMTAKKLWGDEWEEKISTEEGYDEILRRTFTTSDPRNLTVKFLKQFLQAERDQPVNVIYDAGGGQEQVMKDIHQLAKENGFTTTLVHVRTPLDVAQERNIDRPRSLPPEMVAQYHQQVKDNMRNMIPIFDNVWSVDNKELIDLSDRPSDNIEKIK